MRIMRISAIVLAFSLMAAPVLAQGVRMGLKGGVASSTVYGEGVGDDETESLTRFTGGFFVELGVAPLLSIQPELLLSLKGTSFDAGGDDSGDIRLAYIEVPVLAKITLGGAPLRPSIFAGPAVAFNTSCKAEFDVLPGTTVDCADDAVIPDDNSTEFSAIFGVGLAQRLGPVDFVVDGRYNVGLSSAFDGDDAIKNRAFTLLAGFSMGIPGM